MMLRAAAGWRRGFTLVEVLVVTVIIGILLALVSTAVFPALQSAKEFAITSEASQMSMAMEALKAEYGTGNPPADLSSNDLYNYVVRTFPRFTKDPTDNSALTAANLQTYLSGLGVNTTQFDPGNALVFWLVGFSDNPAAPFQGHAARMDGSDMSSPFYDFDTDRLGKDTTNSQVRYFPKLSGDDYANAPPQRAFLYFDKKAYDTPYSSFSAYQKYSTEPPNYYNPKDAQIINAGLDGQLGVGGAPKDGAGADADIPFSGADADNLTNFSGGTMGDYTDQ
jgi:prepilin-type N-terminal cleavage/methylation domain-containing protein